MINAQQLAKRGLTLLRSYLLRPLSQSLSSQNPSLKTHFSSISTTPHLLKNSNEFGSNDNGDGSSPKLMVIQPRIKPNTHLQAKLNEALNLANSLEEQRDGVFSTDLSCKDLPPHVVVQNPLSGSSKGRSDTYFGPGTVENVKIHINAIESQHDELDGVFVNAILSAVQQRNLERVWDKPVLDRVGLIIEIFHAHAYTKEARLQAELAALMYKKSRLVRVRGMDGRQTFGTRGEAEVVSARGRGSGGRGFISGAGETELELQRRRISDRRKQLLAEIADVRRTRAVQRAGRRKQGILDDRGLATVAVVGYTNAGKSTLVSSLSQSDLYSDDRLFATVDPRVRGVTLPSGRKVLLSDTVGFISDLPVQLVEAFHATLEEVAEADLLVHVLDSSAIDLEEQRKAVLDVLRQIGVSEKKIREMIEVWNKIDLQQETIVQNFEDEYAEDFDDDKVETADEQQMQEEDMEDHQSDNSDGWIGPEVGQEKDEIQINASMCRTQSDIQTKEHRDEPIIDKHPDSQSESEHSPLVKTSAVTGAGLKELLRLIDEKLVQIEEPQHSGAVVERTVFDRKWRPKAEDSNIAAEQ